MVDAPSQVDPRTGVHYPAHSQDPRWTDNYIKVAVNELGKIACPVFATASARDTAIPSPNEGNLCYLADVNAIQVYETTWKQVWPSTAPTITSGTAAPSGGANGDVYFQIV